MKVMAIRSENAVDKFITRWQSASGSERANYQLFVHELCTLLELPTPDPARAAGIFTVETKTFSKPARGNAKVTFDGENILVNGFRPDRDPVTQARA